MNRLAKCCGLAVVAILLVRDLTAHEYWVEPKPMSSTPGQPIAISLKVGDGADIEEKKFDPQHAHEFFATNGERRIAITSAEGSLPAASIDLPNPGTWAIVYWSRNKSIELDPKKFEEYLHEDGLEPILEARKERGESAKPAREVYMRCAKALVRVSDSDSKSANASLGAISATKPVGMPLEIVTIGDPKLDAGRAAVGFELLYAGKPLENALVKIVRLDEPTKELTVRTSKEGRFEFIPSAGDWRFSAVHMIRAENEPNAEWQSYWASLTFRIDFPSSTTTKTASDSGS